MNEPNDTIYVNVAYYTGQEEGEDDVGHPYYVATCREFGGGTNGETWGELLRNIHEMLSAVLDGEDTVAEYNLVPNPRVILTIELPEDYAKIA